MQRKHHPVLGFLPANTNFGNHGFVQKMKFCNLNLQIAS
jgi:hypothetical protein